MNRASQSTGYELTNAARHLVRILSPKRVGPISTKAMRCHRQREV